MQSISIKIVISSTLLISIINFKKQHKDFIKTASR
jgi:hypothetical protein